MCYHYYTLLFHLHRLVLPIYWQALCLRCLFISTVQSLSKLLMIYALVCLLIIHLIC